MRSPLSDAIEPATPSDGERIPAAAARQAVQWFVDLQAGDASSKRREEWQRWRQADPAHERAWQRIERVSGKLRDSASPLASAVAQAKLAAEGSTGRRRAVKTLVILVFGGGQAWEVHRHSRWRERMADHRTAVGERGTITLADGTTVMLNTASAVDVRHGATQRRLVLVAGEIFITTAKDSRTPPRAFIVETAQGDVQALGTRFSVRQQADDSLVTVFEGAVEVRPREAGAAAVRLQPGERARFTASQVDGPQAADRTSIAWTRGTLVALSMRLEDFLAELGRYSSVPLSCDPAVADLRVSGSYPTGDVDRVLQTLPNVLPVRVTTVTRVWGTRAMRVGPASSQASAS